MSDQIIWIVLKRLRLPFLVIITAFAISMTGLLLIPGMDANGHPYKMSFFDAFYFVSYMATTIGFGEAPYSFTYPQRIWVSAMIYLTVIGWFYGIGTIISLVQDETLKKAINKNRFRKTVKDLTEPFIIILGYNSITKSIIDRINDIHFRIVLLDKDEARIDELLLNNFYPEVPAFVGEATNQEMLKIAGIHQKNCIAIVSLFEDDIKNSRIAVICSLLNKKVDIIVKTTSKHHMQHFQQMQINHVQNPFEIISKRIYYGITAPHIWLLEMWVYGHILKLRTRDRFPKGKYIICGYGRMGKAIEEGLKHSGIEYSLYPINSQAYQENKESTIFGDDEDIQTLIDLDVQNAVCIIAATQNDLLNLSILNQAALLNPEIYTIARENSLDDISIFQAARVSKVYILEQIVADTTYNFLARPLADLFIQEIRKKDEEWAEIVVNLMNNVTGMNPLYFETILNE